MADRYWVGGTGTWDGTAGTKWSTSDGGSGGASVPTSSDTAFFTASSNIGTDPFTVTVSGSRSCLHLTIIDLDGAMTLDGTSTPILNVYGDLTVPATNFTSTLANIDMESTSTGRSISCPVRPCDSLNFNGAGGSWSLIADSVFGSLVFGRGTFQTANYALTATKFRESASSVDPVVNLGSSVVTLTGTSTVLDFNYNGNVQLNPGTSHVKVQGFGGYIYVYASSTGTYQGLSFYDFTLEGEGVGNTYLSSETWSCHNFTIDVTDITNPVADMYFPNSMTVTGTLSFVGTLPNKRVSWVPYATTTTPMSIAAVSGLSDVDFYGAVVTGAAAPISGTRLGNWGYNSGILFDGLKVVYWNKPAGGDWNDSDAWALEPGGVTSANNIPTSAFKAVVVDTGLNSGATITLSHWYHSCCGLDCSARTLPMTMSFGSGSYLYAYGGVALSSSVTWTVSTASTFILYDGDLNVGGASISPIDIRVRGNTNLLSALSCNAIYVMGSGFLTLNGHAVTAGRVSLNSDSSIDMGGSVVTLTNGSGIVWEAVTNGKINAGTSEIILSAESSSGVTFQGYSQVYNKLTIAGGAATGSVTINGVNNTFAEISSTRTSAYDLKIQTGSTQTIRKWSVNGVFPHRVFVNFTGAGPYDIVFSGGNHQVADRLRVAGFYASGANLYVGTESFDVGGNSNVFFTAPPEVMVYSIDGDNDIYHGQTGIVILPQAPRQFAASGNRVTADFGGVRRNQIVTAESTSSIEFTADFTGFALDGVTPVTINVHVPR